MRTLLASIAFVTFVAGFAACGDEDLEFGEQNDTPDAELDHHAGQHDDADDTDGHPDAHADAVSASQPITVVARVKVRSGSEAAAEGAFRRHVEHVRREEPGTLVYLMHRSRKDATIFAFYERYEDAAAFDRHGKSAAMQSLFRELTPMLDGAPAIDLYDEIDGKR